MSSPPRVHLEPRLGESEPLTAKSPAHVTIRAPARFRRGLGGLGTPELLADRDRDRPAAGVRTSPPARAARLRPAGPAWSRTSRDRHRPGRAGVAARHRRTQLLPAPHDGRRRHAPVRRRRGPDRARAGDWDHREQGEPPQAWFATWGSPIPATTSGATTRRCSPRSARRLQQRLDRHPRGRADHGVGLRQVERRLGAAREDRDGEAAPADHEAQTSPPWLRAGSACTASGFTGPDCPVVAAPARANLRSAPDAILHRRRASDTTVGNSTQTLLAPHAASSWTAGPCTTGGVSRFLIREWVLAAWPRRAEERCWPSLMWATGGSCR